MVTPAASFPASYVDGERFTFRADRASRGAGAGGDTLNWNGLGAKRLFKPTTGGFAQIDANDIVPGQRVDVIYDATLDSSAGGFALMGPPTASVAAPTGAIVAYAGVTAPSAWLFCNGQAISRSTYAALFSVLTIGTTGNFTAGSKVVTGIPTTSGLSAGMPLSGIDVTAGTTILSVDSASQITMSLNASNNGTGAAFLAAPHGVGDGTTTFNLPDLRGRVAAGTDNMGGAAAANRITNAGSGIVGTTLGANGGGQSLAAHSHTITDPTHAHGVNDPPHNHNGPNGVNAWLSSGGGSGFGPGGSSPDIFPGQFNTNYAVTGIGIVNAATGINATNSAGTGASGNVQPTLMTNYIIKT